MATVRKVKYSLKNTNSSLGWLSNCHYQILHLPGAKINVTAQFSLISQGSNWQLRAGQLHEISFLMEEKWFIFNRRDIKFCTMQEYEFAFSACFMYRLCLWIQQVPSSLLWKSQNLVSNQQTMVLPGLPWILKFALPRI